MFLKNLPKNISSYFILILAVLISTAVLWSPFILHAKAWFGIGADDSSLLYVYKQYDGPLYVIAAKTMYDPKQIEIPKKGLIISLPLSAKYFAAHLPLYPLFIRLFAPMLGYLKSMVFVNIISTILLCCFFYFMVRKLRLSNNPLILSIIFLFLPRFLVVRSVGAPESLFILLILLSLYFFEKEKYITSGVLGGLAAMAKAPGVLLFVAYSLVFVEKFLKTKKINLKWLAILLIPLGTFAVFLLYQVRYGDFFAYFHSGDNIHLVAPFSAFNFRNRWVSTAWLDDILFYFFIYLLSTISLFKNKYRSLFYFCLVFFTATTFVAHRDISRYSLPLWPLALIAFERFFTSKKFLLGFVILLPAIYLYAWNFLLYNVIPISDWRPFL